MLAGVRTIGAGSVLPVDVSWTVANVSSVVGGLFGSAFGMNSLTVAWTVTRLPTAAVGGGAELVKTNTPSEVLGSELVALGFLDEEAVALDAGDEARRRDGLAGERRGVAAALNVVDVREAEVVVLNRSEALDVAGGRADDVRDGDADDSCAVWATCRR